MNTRVVIAIALLLCTLSIAAPDAARAQAYPSRPVRLVVPQPPGGHSDLLARIVAEPMSQRLNQPVVIEHRPGAGGTIAAEAVARAAADGYTMLFGGSNTMGIAAAVVNDLRYSPSDFAAIGTIARVSYGLAVNPQLPATSIAEFVAYARTHPHELNYASTGVGSTSNLLFSLLRRTTGIDIVHVPFKGSAHSVNELVAGRVDALFTDLAALAPLASRGAVRLIAVGSVERSPLVPEIPSVAEQGFAELAREPWYGLFVPASTPADIVATLNAALVETLRTPAIRKRFQTLGFVPLETSPSELTALVGTEMKEFRALIGEGEVSPDR